MNSGRAVQALARRSLSSTPARAAASTGANEPRPAQKQSFLERIKDYTQNSALRNILGSEKGSREAAERRKSKELGITEERLQELRVRTEERRLGLQMKQDAEQRRASERRVVEFTPYVDHQALSLRARPLDALAQALRGINAPPAKEDGSIAHLTAEERLQLLKHVLRTTGIRIPDRILYTATSTESLSRWLTSADARKAGLSLREQRKVNLPAHVAEIGNVHVLGRLRSREARSGGEIRLTEERLAQLRQASEREFRRFVRNNNYVLV